MRIIILAVTILIQFGLPRSSGAESNLEVTIDSTRDAQKDFIGCGGDCPDFLGLVTFYLSAPSPEQDLLKFDKCLSTLIAPDEIITNAHCLPSVPLRKYIRVIFPKSKNHPAELVKIKEVVQLSDRLKNPLVDYAILKLDHPLNRATANLHPQKISEGQSLISYTHSFQKDEKTGLNFLLLRSQRCSTSEFSMTGEKHNVTLKLGNCITASGDSGGPLLTESGDLAGILWGGGNTYTYGLNGMCLPGPSGAIPTGQCVQPLDVAVYNLVQGIGFNDLFIFNKFGGRAPVSDEISGGKIFYHALSCFSQIPTEPFEVQETALFVAQKDLEKNILPLEDPIPVVRQTVTVRLQPQADRLLLQVLDQDKAILVSDVLEHCSQVR